MRSILVTRPEPAGSELAAKLRLEGFEAYLAPLSRYVPLPADLDALPPCDALVFTSAQGVGQFPPAPAGRDKPVFTVGTATAEAAQQAGFKNVISAGGDVRDLAQLLIARKDEFSLSAVLHVSGEDTAEDLGLLLADSGIAVESRIAYRTEFIDRLPPDIEQALLHGKIDAILLFSARAAQHWLKLLQNDALRAAAEKMEVICMSERVAAELRGAPWKAIKVAHSPQTEAMLEILRGAGGEPQLPLTLPADPVIEAFGGLRPLANRLGLTASTVQGWKKRGIIPDTRVEAIYAAAAEDNIDINALLAKGQYKMTMDDAGRPIFAGDPERRRSTDRRQQKTVYDAQGNVRAPGYTGPDRRSGIDRRAHRARQQQRIREEKMRFISRTVVMSAFFIAALAYAGAFLMAPEFFAFTKRQAEEEATQEKLRSYEEQIRELQRRQQELRKQQQGALPTDTQQTASPGIGQRLNNAIGTVEGAVSSVKTAASTVSAETQEMVRKSETYRSLQSLMRMMAMVNTLMGSNEGAEQTGSMMGRLRAVMSDAPADPQGLSEAVLEAQKSDPTLAQVMGGVAPKDLGAAAMLLTMNELRGNIGGGQSFESDLKIIQKYAKGDPEMEAALKRVAPYARSGVLSSDTLKKEFRNIAADIVMAKLQGEDASVRQRVLDRLSKYAKMRKIDDIEGNTVDATVARAELMLDQGDVKGAIKELQTLEGAPADTAAPWVEQAQGHVAADESSQVLMQTVLQYLGGSGATALGGFGNLGDLGLDNLQIENSLGILMQQLQGGGGGTVVPYMSPSLQQGSGTLPFGGGSSQTPGLTLPAPPR